MMILGKFRQPLNCPLVGSLSTDFSLRRARMDVKPISICFLLLSLYRISLSQRVVRSIPIATLLIGSQHMRQNPSL